MGEGQWGRGLSPRPWGAPGWLHPLHPRNKGRGQREGSWNRRKRGGVGISEREGLQEAGGEAGGAGPGDLTGRMLRACVRACVCACVCV